MISLYLDEDTSSGALAAALRALGVDVQSTVEANRRTLPDSNHLAYAAAAGRTIYTRNRRDFQQLHTTYMETGQTHAGIIIASRRRPSIGDQARALARLSDARTPATMQNRLEYLTAWLE